MSNVFKSKYLLGGMMAVVMVLAFAATTLAYTHTVTLSVGSKGTQVVELQKALGISADGSFGPMTKQAVISFQSKNGLGADGVVGAMTGAKLAGGAAGCTGFDPATGKPCGSTSSSVPGCMAGYMYSSTTGAKCDGSNGSTGSLAGTDGSISDVNELSQYNNEEVGEGMNDVKVLGFEVEASNDGDIALKSLKLSFDPAGNGGSDHLDDYIDSVTVWQGSTKVGSADVGDFSQGSSDNIYTKTITLSNSVVEADQTEKFYVSVDAVNNLDSGDITSDSWTVDVENIRVQDGSGVVTTETGYDLDGMDVPVSFVSFSTAADTELKVSTDSSTPEAGIAIVDTSSNTDGVVLLKGKFKLDGSSDVVIDKLPVTLTLTGATNIDAVASSLILVLDGTEYTESLGANCDPTCAGANSSATVTFDNLNFDMNAGDTVSFVIKADINDIEAGVFDEGDTLTATITTAQVDDVLDVENSEGDQLATSETSGSATGKAQEFRSQGISLTLVDTTGVSSNDTGAANDTATFTIKFKVTAIGEDAYIATYTPLTYFPYVVDLAGTATTGGVSAVIVNNTDTTLSPAYNWQIDAGTSETLTLTVNRIPTGVAAVGLYRAALTGVLWSDSDDNTPGNTYSSNMDSFKTAYVSVN